MNTKECDQILFFFNLLVIANHSSFLWSLKEGEKNETASEKIDLLYLYRKCIKIFFFVSKAATWF